MQSRRRESSKPTFIASIWKGLIAALLKLIQNWIIVTLVTIVASSLSGFYGGWAWCSHWYRTFSPREYRNDGLVSTFNGRGPQHDIATCLNEQISIFSDSAFCGSSSITYERMPCDAQHSDGDGYLRIHYKLRKSKSLVDPPYVGVFADFSTPPRLFDISHFDAVRLKVRSCTNNSIVKCSFHLCDMKTAQLHNYAWPGASINMSSLNTKDFVPITLRFADFSTPDWAVDSTPPEKRTPPLDTSVFRFAFKILGPAGQDVDGEVDIDDILFTK